MGRRIVVSLRLLLIGSILGAVLGVLAGACGRGQAVPSSPTTSITVCSFVVLAIPVFVLAVLLKIGALDVQRRGRANALRVHRRVHPGPGRRLLDARSSTGCST